MNSKTLLASALLALAVASPVVARAPVSAGAAALSVTLECVPYARATSGIRIYGDAHTWWDQAAGHYARGFTPRVGAVMAFKPYGKMVLGHVATVSHVIDARTVLLRHANWSPINGHAGQIENDVRAVDVSPGNDWSRVRVWFAPLQGLGGTAWPVQGFIYGKKPHLAENAAPRREEQAPVYGARHQRGAETGSGEDGDGDPVGAIIAAFSRW